MSVIGGSQPQVIDKGKGKMRAEDFDAAFAQAAAVYQTKPAKIEEIEGVTEILANTTLEDGSSTKQTTPASEDFKT
jgi:hypothetical protein